MGLRKSVALQDSAKERPVGIQPNNLNSRLGLRTGPEVDTAHRPLTFLRFPAVRARTGLSRTTVWRLERQGDFPRHRRISSNAVAWAEHEVADWIRSKLGTSSQPLP
jgi:prophage regulatory protein